MAFSFPFMAVGKKLPAAAIISTHMCGVDQMPCCSGHAL
jgi:hypothetical protein